MTDTTARTILIVGFAIVFPFGMYNRLKARTDEKLDRRQEGWFVLLTLRPLALACMIGMLCYLVNPRWMAWAAIAIPGWLRWCGVGLGIVSAGLLLWTQHCLGKNLTDTVVTRRDAHLVTRGPYRWVRHPFYTAFALAVIANALVTANAYLAITGALAFAAIAIRTPIEERNLLNRFGSDYADYMQRTGRFVPKLFRG